MTLDIIRSAFEYPLALAEHIIKCAAVVPR